MDIFKPIAWTQNNIFAKGMPQKGKQQNVDIILPKWASCSWSKIIKNNGNNCLTSLRLCRPDALKSDDHG